MIKENVFFSLPGFPSRYLLSLALTVLAIISSSLSLETQNEEIPESMFENGADYSVVLNSVPAVLASATLLSSSVVLPSIFTILTGQQIFKIL